MTRSLPFRLEPDVHRSADEGLLARIWRFFAESAPLARVATGSAARDRLLIGLLPLLLQLPGLLGFIDVDPLTVLSGLGIGGMPGLIPGQPAGLDPNIGFTTQALGRLAADSWLAGVIPWWNPYSGVGVPLAAEMQPAAFFLPFVLLLHFDNGVVLLRVCLQVIAGVGTYELLRELRLARPACLVGGLLAAFGGTLSWLPDSPSHPVPFLPLLLLGVERARRAAGEHRRGGWAWIAVALAWSLLAGFPETAYVDGLLVAAWSAWRLIQSPAEESGARWRFARKVALGVVAGLCLAAPAVWPFLHLLMHADPGVRGAFSRVGLPGAAFPMFVMPYVYGTPWAVGGGVGGPTAILWGSVGGYVGTVATGLALPCVLHWRGREGGLRLVLAGWIVLCLGKTAAVPLVTQAFNLLPFIAEAAFFRYAEPSWTFACIVLAGLTVDAWWSGTLPRAARIAAILVELALMVVLARLAAPTIYRLAAHSLYVGFFILIAEWSVALLAATGLVLLLRPGRRTGRAIVVLAGLDAIASFGLPLLSSTRHRQVDLAPIAFLRDHLSLQRFYSLGAIAPNYGAYYGLASIDETLVPMPGAWADTVRRIDPNAEPAVFNGAPRGDRSVPQPLGVLRANPDAYRALGVRYVVTARGAEAASHSAATAPAAEVALPLAPGERATGHLAPGLLAPGERLDQLAVLIGTYAGLADGRLAAEICSPRGCARGSTALAGAPDNVGRAIELTPSLVVEPGDTWTFSLTHEGGSSRVAIWASVHSAALLDKPRMAAGPVITLVYGAPDDLLRPVFRGETADIFEITGAAPYFEADRGCVLTVSDRLHVVADCERPGRLVRRELAYPGWRAVIGGKPAPLSDAGLFQAIDLPAGRSAVAFRYAPPFAGLTWAAALVGAALVAVGSWRSRSRGFPRTPPSAKPFA